MIAIVDDFLDEIEAALAARLYLVALRSALAVPDICGALGHPSGRATGPRYKAWFEENVPEYREYLSGERCYAFRNSLLHQGSARHERRRDDRIIFVQPGLGVFIHRARVVIGEGVQVVVLDLPTFVQDVIRASRSWLQSKSTDRLVWSNRLNQVQRYPNGLAPYIEGAPVIG